MNHELPVDRGLFDAGDAARICSFLDEQFLRHTNRVFPFSSLYENVPCPRKLSRVLHVKHKMSKKLNLSTSLLILMRIDGRSYTRELSKAQSVMIPGLGAGFIPETPV